MSVDLSEFVALSRPKKKQCSIGEVLKALPAGDREKLAAALAQDNSVITAAAVIAWCSARGHTGVNSSTIVHHRAGSCSCRG